MFLGVKLDFQGRLVWLMSAQAIVLMVAHVCTQIRQFIAGKQIWRVKIFHCFEN